MGVLEKLRTAPLAVPIAVACLIALGIVIIWEIKGSRPPGPPTKAFFSDDDGKTWFVDSMYNIPPFTDQNGKTAYGAGVFKYDKGEYVGYLERYTPKAKKRLDELMAQAKAQGQAPELAMAAAEVHALQDSGLEAKPPGSDKWELERNAVFIRSLQSPDGSQFDGVFP
jgi:hypothetical protein